MTAASDLPPPPESMARLPRDRRGLPVPHVAGWTSEVWGVARAELLIPGRPMALYCSGRQGRGQPMFDVVNEERQRSAVLRGRCQVCNGPLPLTDSRTTGQTRPYGWLPEYTITNEHRAHTDAGEPVTHEPLLCRPCCDWVVLGCCVLGRHPSGILRVERYERLIQYVDPSRVEENKAARYGDHPEARERLGRIARRHGGLVGFVKVVLTGYVKEPA